MMHILEPSLASFGVVVALSIGLGVLTALAFRKKNDAPFNDTPTTLSSQGSRVPLLYGVRRVGAVHVLAGGRFTKKESPEGGGGGKGGGGKGGAGKVDIYFEYGIHVLAVGPGRALKRVLVQGEPIWQGYISSKGAPSGTRVDLGKEGIFEIQWGKPDDPPDQWANEKLGTASRFDSFFRINWITRRLGQIPQWNVIDYEIEVEPDTVLPSLSQEDAWFEGELVEKPEWAADIIGTDLDNNIFYIANVPSSDILEILALLVFKLPFESNSVLYSGALKVKVNAPANGLSGVITQGQEFTVLSVIGDVRADETNLPTSSNCATPNALNPALKLTAIRVLEDLPGTGAVSADSPCAGFGNAFGNPQGLQGTLIPIVEGDDNGANGAHVLASVLFAPAPRGIGLNPALWDQQSFKTVSDIVISEGIRTTILAEQGQTAQSLLSDILTDLGVFVRLNSNTGLLELVPLRQNQQPVVEIPPAALHGSLPEVSYSLRTLRTNKVVYTFADRAQAYRNAMITIGDDGAAALGQYEGVEEVRLPTVTDFPSAAKIASRRSQEALGTQDLVQLEVGYAGRNIRPGQEIKIPEFPYRLLVLKVTLEPDGVGARLDASPTGYLAPPVPFELENQSDSSSQSIPLPDYAQFRLWEPPTVLKLSAAPVELRALWVRKNASATQLILNLSVDGTTFTAASVEPVPVFGGTITEPLDGTSSDVAQVAIEFVSPDVASVPSLEGNAAAIDAGQLLCLIGDEICFLGGVEAAPGSTQTGILKTLKRAKYGSAAAPHAAGTPFYVWQPNTLLPQTNSAFIQSGVEFFAKPQAIGAAPPIPLTELPVYSFTPA